MSVPTNIVEGCARRTERDFLRFVEVALGSASEAKYLLSVAARLGYLQSEPRDELETRYREVVRSLQNLLTAFRA